MKKNYSRYLVTAVFLLAMMAALIYQLGMLTIVEGAGLSEEADSRSQSSIATKGTRGKILDRNGIVLAYSETCYNVQFQRDPDKRTAYDSVIYTESLIKAIEIIEKGGGSMIDTSYIRMDEKGELYFDFRVTSDSAIKARYKNFCAAIGVTIEDDLTKPQAEWNLNKWPTAEYCYNMLRKSWHIPEEMSFDEAVKIISIRQEVLLNNYRAYEPITIAYDVGMDVIAQLEMLGDALPGIQTEQSTTRIYPYGTTAAHILGYLSGSVSPSVTASYLEGLGFTKEEYKDAVTYDSDGITPLTDENGNILYSMLKLGYSYSDYIGVSGIEATMEAYLTAATTEHQGTTVVEVNKNGSIIREISESEATDGSDVMLTIDLDLQQVAEAALEDLITTLAEKEKQLIEEDAELPEKDQQYTQYNNIKTAATGAIVVMDIRDGTVLAVASYPSFDPNWFIQGLTAEQSEYLFGESAANTTPMRNKAISSKLAPGSIFKMCTGVAGISEGVIGLRETVNDAGYYYVTNEDGSLVKTGAPRCWTKYYSKHQDQDITRALTNSCNYYFYTVAERLGIEKLNEWSGYFGFTSATGIELTGEAVGIVGGQSVLFDNMLLDSSGELSIPQQKTSLPGLVYKKLREYLTQYVQGRNMEPDDAAIRSCALAIMQLQDGSMDGKGPQIRSLLSSYLGLPEGVTAVQPWVQEITSLLNEIQWKPTQTIRSGIGQGVTLVTPIAVARYISAIANEGTVYNARIVERILAPSGGVEEQFVSEVFYKLDVDDAVWDAVKEGMKGVVSPEDGGTAATAFSKGFAYLDRLSGKTGTAQVSSNRPDIENTSWFVCFAPRENPEIAVVVCVPNGKSGVSSAPAVEDIITYYFDKQESAAPENLVAANSIAP